jgi:hypothetical protein
MHTGGPPPLSSTEPAFTKGLLVAPVAVAAAARSSIFFRRNSAAVNFFVDRLVILKLPPILPLPFPLSGVGVGDGDTSIDILQPHNHNSLMKNTTKKKKFAALSRLLHRLASCLKFDQPIAHHVYGKMV